MPMAHIQNLSQPMRRNLREGSLNFSGWCIYDELSCDSTSDSVEIILFPLGTRMMLVHLSRISRLQPMKYLPSPKKVVRWAYSKFPLMPESAPL